MRWPWSGKAAPSSYEDSRRDLEQMLEQLAETDLGKGLVAEQRRQREERRLELRRELDAGDEAERQELQVLEAEAAKLGDVAGDAERAAAEARRLANDATQRAAVAPARYRVARERIRSELAELAPPEIGLFIEWANQEEARVRQLRPRSFTEERLGGLIKETHTDGDAIARALATIRQARRDAEALALELLSPAELETRLSALRRQCSSATEPIGVLETVTSVEGRS